MLWEQPGRVDRTSRWSLRKTVHLKKVFGDFYLIEVKLHPIIGCLHLYCCGYRETVAFFTFYFILNSTVWRWQNLTTETRIGLLQGLAPLPLPHTLSITVFASSFTHLMDCHCQMWDKLCSMGRLEEFFFVAVQYIWLLQFLLKLKVGCYFNSILNNNNNSSSSHGHLWFLACTRLWFNLGLY